MSREICIVKKTYKIQMTTYSYFRVTLRKFIVMDPTEKFNPHGSLSKIIEKYAETSIYERKCVLLSMRVRAFTSTQLLPRYSLSLLLRVVSIKHKRLYIDVYLTIWKIWKKFSRSEFATTSFFLQFSSYRNIHVKVIFFAQINNI